MGRELGSGDGREKRIRGSVKKRKEHKDAGEGNLTDSVRL